MFNIRFLLWGDKFINNLYYDPVVGSEINNLNRVHPALLVDQPNSFMLTIPSCRPIHLLSINCGPHETVPRGCLRGPPPSFITAFTLPNKQSSVSIPRGSSPPILGFFLFLSYFDLVFEENAFIHSP